MTLASVSQFHVYLEWVDTPPFSVIVQLRRLIVCSTSQKLYLYLLSIGQVSYSYSSNLATDPDILILLYLLTFRSTVHTMNDFTFYNLLMGIMMCNSKNFYSEKVINGHVPFAIYIIRRRKTIALQ